MNNEEFFGRCDTCGNSYLLTERDVTNSGQYRCGDCGNCSNCCPHKNDEKGVVFSQMDNRGSVTKTRVINFSDIQRCPKVILVPEHYEEDGTCRCNNPQCDWEDCTAPKYNDEIYCREHVLILEPDYED